MSVFGEFYDPADIYRDELDSAKRSYVLKQILEGDLVSREQIEPLILAGVPDALRSTLWRRYSAYGFDTDVQYSEELIESASVASVDIIERDTPRTYPNSKTPENAKLLGNVLRAYAGADPEVGYTQGMNFVASFPVLYMSEADAFQTMYCVMNNPAIYLRDVYRTGFDGLFELGNAWLKLLEKRHKWFWRKLKAGSTIDPVGIVQRCWQSLLVAFDVPVHLQLTMFDRIVVCGKRALLSFAVAVIRMFARELQNLDPDEMQMFLMQMDKSAVFKDCNLVMSCWNKEWVSENEYKSLFIYSVSSRMVNSASPSITGIRYFSSFVTSQILAVHF